MSWKGNIKKSRRIDIDGLINIQEKILSIFEKIGKDSDIPNDAIRMALHGGEYVLDFLKETKMEKLQ